MMNSPAPAAEVDDLEAQEETLALSKVEESKKTALGSLAETEEDEGPVYPKAPNLITTSGLPAGHWKNLFHLDLVKERNKPKEAPKKPESAPFFLQRRSDFQGVLDKVDQKEVDSEVKNVAGKKKKEDKKELEGWDAAWSDDDEEEWGGDGDGEDEAKDEEGVGGETTSKLIKSFETGNGDRKIVDLPRNKLAALLTSCAPLQHFGAVQTYLASLSPSAIDLALTTLCTGPEDSEGIDLLVLFCSYLRETCESGANFEAVHAYMSRFFTVHGEIVRGADVEGKEGEVQGKRIEQMEKHLEIVRNLVECQDKSSKKLKGKLQYSLSLLRLLSKEL